MTKKERKKNSESAVSETVGYILIFGIMMTGIGLITLYGYPLLLNEQANANIKNMDRNMIVLQNDVNALMYKSVPYKETTMQVSGGTLFAIDSLATPQRFEITQGMAENDIPELAFAFPDGYFYPGEIRFISDGETATITLENGAIITSWISDNIGSAMLSEPRWFIDISDYDGDGVDESTLVINLIQIQSGDFAKTGISTIKLKISPIDFDSDPAAINNLIQITSPTDRTVNIRYLQNTADKNYRFAWDNFFNKEEFDDQTGERDYILRITNIDRLIIKGSIIEVVSL